MIAESFAILGAVGYAVGNLFIRRAVMKVTDTTAGVLISLPVGWVLFTVILVSTGHIDAVTKFSWQSYLWLSAAGIVQFVGGRMLFYKCVQLIGANTTVIFTRVSPLIAVTLGISILNEPLTWQLVVGAVLVVLGVTLTGLNPQMFRSGQRLFSGVSSKAFLLGIGAGLAWGVTPILVKLGLSGGGSPVAGALVAYTAATVILSFTLLGKDRRAGLTGMGSSVIGLFALTSLFFATAHVLRYAALSMAPASVIAPLFSISPVLLIILSFLFNRNLETFNTNVIIGAIAVVAGAILVI